MCCAAGETISGRKVATGEGVVVRECERYKKKQSTSVCVCVYNILTKSITLSTE